MQSLTVFTPDSQRHFHSEKLTQDLLERRALQRHWSRSTTEPQSVQSEKEEGDLLRDSDDARDQSDGGSCCHDGLPSLSWLNRHRDAVLSTPLPLWQKLLCQISETQKRDLT